MKPAIINMKLTIINIKPTITICMELIQEVNEPTNQIQIMKYQPNHGEFHYQTILKMNKANKREHNLLRGT